MEGFTLLVIMANIYLIMGPFKYTHNMHHVSSLFSPLSRTGHLGPAIHRQTLHRSPPHRPFPHSRSSFPVSPSSPTDRASPAQWPRVLRLLLGGVDVPGRRRDSPAAAHVPEEPSRNEGELPSRRAKSSRLPRTSCLASSCPSCSCSSSG